MTSIALDSQHSWLNSKPGFAAKENIHARRFPFPLRLQPLGQRENARRLPEADPGTICFRAGAALGIRPLHGLAYCRRHRRLAADARPRTRSGLPAGIGSADAR